MKKEKKTKDFKRKATYPGGMSALKAFLKKELNYPAQARAAGIAGSVLVQYTVNHLGAVTNTKVISGIGYGCDEEAERVIRLLKFEADKNRGYKSKYTQTLGIHFKPEKNVEKEVSENTPQARVQFEYQISPSPQKNTPEKDKKGKVYQYTIEW